MSRLTSDEIEQLAEAFDDYHHEEYPETHPSVENPLTNLLTNQDYLSTSDVADAMEWKLESQGGRFERYKSKLKSVPPEYVELVTEAAFMLDETRQQMKTLYAIPGVGYATATVLMAFNNPVDYAVGDRYQRGYLGS
jgi:endonuclease III